MQRLCTRCSASFDVTDADLALLEKASPKIGEKTYTIPPPTLCPRCRVQRRMAWRNDRTFYKRKCDLTGEEFVSMYPSDVPFPVYKQDAWHGDKWNALAFGRDVDINRPFFEQWAELRDRVPHWGVAISNCQNSEYCNYCTDEKNCYLDIAAEANEDCYFDLFTKYSKNCVDCTFAYHSTLCYECIQCYNCYSCQHSMYLEHCNDCGFCFDCKGCKNCLLSVNLRNKEYHILNEPHTKEEYERKLRELNTASHSSLQEIFRIWNAMRIEKGIYRDMYNLNCENCVGNDIKNSKNCSGCFNATNCEDSKNLFDVLDAKDCMDMNYSLYSPEASYEVISTVGLKFSAFYMAGPYNTSCFYSFMLQSCKDCFGCISLKQKQYCILNKQYTKAEYEELVPKIIEHMQTTGEYGEFFPASLSPHGYNETVSQEYYPLSKDDALRLGFRWRDEGKKETVPQTCEIPDAIIDVKDGITKETLLCSGCGKNYRIIPQELRFYRKLSVPLPRACPDCRHRARIALRNPRQLWNRQCAKCGKGILTSYQPPRPETVYCERCYLEAVY